MTEQIFFPDTFPWQSSLLRHGTGAQVTQLRSQLSQLQDILCDDDAAPVPPGADMEAAGEAFDSSSDEEEEEEPGLPLPGDIDNLNMPVEVVGADALVHAAGANRPAKQASAPMPAELQALPSETVSIKEVIVHLTGDVTAGCKSALLDDL